MVVLWGWLELKHRTLFASSSSRPIHEQQAFWRCRTHCPKDRPFRQFRYRFTGLSYPRFGFGLDSGVLARTQIRCTESSGFSSLSCIFIPIRCGNLANVYWYRGFGRGNNSLRSILVTSMFTLKSPSILLIDRLWAVMTSFQCVWIPF